MTRSSRPGPLSPSLSNLDDGFQRFGEQALFALLALCQWVDLRFAAEPSISVQGWRAVSDGQAHQVGALSFRFGWISTEV